MKKREKKWISWLVLEHLIQGYPVPTQNWFKNTGMNKTLSFRIGFSMEVLVINHSFWLLTFMKLWIRILVWSHFWKWCFFFLLWETWEWNEVKGGSFKKEAYFVDQARLKYAFYNLHLTFTYSLLLFIIPSQFPLILQLFCKI